MIAEMAKVHIALPLAQADELYTWLQEREIIEVTKLARTANNDAAGSWDLQLAQIQFALEFISRVREELTIETPRPLRELFAGKPTATLARLEQSLGGLGLKQLLKNMHSLSDQLGAFVAQQEKAREIERSLHPWQDLSVTGVELAGTPNVRHALITVSVQEEMLVKRKLLAIDDLALQEVGRTVTKKQGQVFWEVVVLRMSVAKLDAILAETNAEAVQLPVPGGQTVAQYAQALRTQIVELKQQYRQTLNEAKQYLKMERELKFSYDALLHRQERDRARRLAAHLTHAEVLAGWVPKYKLAELGDELARTFPTAALEEVAVAANETPPTHLKNSVLMQPFEAVTNIFGQPKYTEIDPSGPLSLFFLIAFGLALTDAGYGIVMMIVMWAAERFFRLTRPLRNMVRLLFYAGASTIVFGALSGGWFGMNIEALPGEVGDILLSLKVIDPISEPLVLLVVALAFGIVQLLFAWSVRGYDHLRKGDIAGLLFDDLGWIAMVVTLLLWAGARQELLPVGWEKPLWLSVLAVGGVLILTQGRSYKNPLLKVGGGLLSLYGLVNFLSDTLSYSRLLALGLATGIIALVVNLIGTMVVAAVPIPLVGWLLAAAVLLIGHTFNLLINTLGAFIHSGRLQFVEFFPKFIMGGGRPYHPLGWVGKYVANPREFS
jgi:V/A-type H+/Na+-transporting ATPase subunit I